MENEFEIIVKAGLWKKNLHCAMPFWVLCLLLFLMEQNFSYSATSALLFLLSIPALVGFLAWANRMMLYATPKRGVAFSLYGGIVFLSAFLTIVLGLMIGVFLKA